MPGSRELSTGLLSSMSWAEGAGRVGCILGVNGLCEETSGDGYPVENDVAREKIQCSPQA